MRGNVNWEHVKEIDACPQEFDPDQFASQTCFQGRYGEYQVTPVLLSLPFTLVSQITYLNSLHIMFPHYAFLPLVTTSHVIR